MTLKIFESSAEPTTSTPTGNPPSARPPTGEKHIVLDNCGHAKST